jgi:pimeloyl-ACP methyl ester carboxylesterase
LNWKGGEIHYTESGSGFPILMIHGFGGSNRDFYILDSLMNKDYRVIRVDLPGFGLSDFPKQTGQDVDYTKEYDEYFNFLLDTLNSRFLLCYGQFFRRNDGLEFTVKHPNVVKKLILFNSAGYDMEAVSKTANAYIFRYKMVQLLLQRGIPKFATAKGVGRVFYKAPMLTEEKVQRLNDFWNREGNLPHILAMASSTRYLDQTIIKQINCPTLIVWGKYDKIVSPEICRAIPSRYQRKPCDYLRFLWTCAYVRTTRGCAK